MHESWNPNRHLAIVHTQQQRHLARRTHESQRGGGGGGGAGWCASGMLGDLRGRRETQIRDRNRLLEEPRLPCSACQIRGRVWVWIPGRPSSRLLSGRVRAFHVVAGRISCTFQLENGALVVVRKKSATIRLLLQIHKSLGVLVTFIDNNNVPRFRTLGAQQLQSRVYNSNLV